MQLWRYLGYKISSQTIKPQLLQLDENPQTLPDMQRLLGAITWVRSLLGITNQDLQTLFDLLEGDSAPKS